MMFSQADRIVFSGQIVSAQAQIAGIQAAQAQLQGAINKAQLVDNANSDIYNPVNLLVNGYQAERQLLSGITRTVIVEQNIQDSANRILGNIFFPNVATTVVPDLVPYNNVWTQFNPFAFTYAIGKDYVEEYPGTVTKEGDMVTLVMNAITATAAFVDMENTTGQHCITMPGTCSNSMYTDQTSCQLNGGTWHPGVCSIPMYTDQASCLAAMPMPGIWTPGVDTIVTYAPVVTAKDNLVTAVNNLIAFIESELPTIVLDDPNATNQAQNNAAIANINTVILPALNLWLSYPDFNTAHGQTTCLGFYGYNSNLLAPTKLHSTQLTALTNALNTRDSFVATRISQIDTDLGTVTQDVTNGNIISNSGIYGQRYSYLDLRLNALTGSLTQLNGAKGASNAQSQIVANIMSTEAIYETLVSATLLKAPTNGTSTIQVVDSSLFSAGDTIYIVSDIQPELQRAIKSINADVVVLNDTVAAKYFPVNNGRMYKVLPPNT